MYMIRLAKKGQKWKSKRLTYILPSWRPGRRRTCICFWQIAQFMIPWLLLRMRVFCTWRLCVLAQLRSMTLGNWRYKRCDLSEESRSASEPQANVSVCLDVTNWNGMEGTIFSCVLDKVSVVSVAVCDTRQKSMNFMQLCSLWRWAHVWASEGRWWSPSLTSGGSDGRRWQYLVLDLQWKGDSKSRTGAMATCWGKGYADDLGSSGVWLQLCGSWCQYQFVGRDLRVKEFLKAPSIQSEIEVAHYYLSIHPIHINVLLQCCYTSKNPTRTLSIWQEGYSSVNWDLHRYLQKPADICQQLTVVPIILGIADGIRGL